MRAFDRPKVKACIPAPFTCLVKYQIISARKMIGRIKGDKTHNQYPSPVLSFIWIFAFANSSAVKP